MLVLSAILLILVTIYAPEVKAADAGGDLYLGHCAKCHGREGEGFLKLYPPIRNTSYLNKNVSKLPCIIRYGLKGEILVDGVTFNQIMPAMPQLQSEDIEKTIHLLQESWNHPITPLEVNKWLEECSK